MPLNALMMLAMSWQLMAPAQELQMPTVPAVARQAPGGCTSNLTFLARRSILGALPVGHRLMSTTVQNVCVPQSEGRLQCKVEWPDGLNSGANAAVLLCSGKSRKVYQIAAEVDLQTTLAAKAAVVIARGADVKIVVRSGNVTVQAAAVAQESAGLGEPVQVLPTGATKVVRGRVVDAHTVEVML